MSNNKINKKQPPDLTDSLPVAKDTVGPANALESQLKAIGGQDSDFLENLKPAVRKRVEVLRGIQSEYDELEAKVFEERAALEAKYQKQYAPLYSKRYDIVSGAVEVDRANEEDAMDQTDDTEKGVPEFWLTTMKHNVITAKEITQRDEEALKYLKDIKWCRMDDLKGFKLEFFFDTNPFFTNSVLTKVYHMIDYDKPIFEKAIGTTIEWLPRKCLTQKILKKRPKKGSKDAKPITKTEDCESFFNFFSPPEIFAGSIYNSCCVKLMGQDYNIGLTVRDMIIPHAVSLFTGEANQNDEDDDWIEEDDDEGEEETETKKSQLKAIGGHDSDVLENLKPTVRKRVAVLRGIQSEYDELQAKFFVERAALEAKYQKLYAPLYSKRYDIVTGAVEVDGAKEEDAMDQKDDTEKGVPEFWLTAMKHNLITAKEIKKRDEEALKYLKNIKFMDYYPKGFKLEFFFDTNPFFTNSVLTKLYLMKTIGTTIEWLPRKCLTQKIFRKKNQTCFRKMDYESFFNFFSPPEDERRQWLDYNIGFTIRHNIIPHAVSCFTGEANQGVLQGFVSVDDEDDEDDEDDDDEIEYYEEEAKTKKKSQLKAIGGQDSDVLENLKPTVRKRVEVLRGIQNEHDELEAKFFEEKAKYQNLYAPLYSKRYDIVTGAVEVDGAKEEDAMDQTDDTEKGVPEFWLTAMKHNKITAEKITERDEEALKYLIDVKCCRMDDPKGFKLEFFFDTNPFFTNSVLTKVYHMRSSVRYHKLIIEKTIGTTIEWLPGKCLAQKTVFNFFGPWLYGYLEFGLTIRDKIIPHAVSWFTGEANQEDFRGFDNEDNEDDEDEEETETKNKSQLKSIEGQDSDLLENLKPAVRKRVEVLRGIQSEHDELEAKYFEEKAKYQKVIAPLYSKRYDIVTGAVEVDGAKEEDAMDQTDGTEKGVPEFWLTAMKHNEFRLRYLRYTITERDEEALKYLKDIKWCRTDDPKGFKLEFFFDTNPFFTNSFLTKVYHMRSSCYFDKLILEKAIGTTIEWLPGKCLTQMILEMKPKKGSKNAKTITETQDCSSFFNFFSPPEEKKHLMKEDYYVGLSIRDKIIPHAVSWFAGEAIPTRGRKISVLLGGFYDEDDDDYEDDDQPPSKARFAMANYDKHPASVKNFGIPRIKNDRLEIPSQSVQASITGVKPEKKNDRLEIPAAIYDKHPASVKNFGIPSQSVQASITGVKPGKKNDRLDIPASS